MLYIMCVPHLDFIFFITDKIKNEKNSSLVYFKKVPLIVYILNKAKHRKNLVLKKLELKEKQFEIVRKLTQKNCYFFGVKN